MKSGARYFTASALAGRLFVGGLSNLEGWNPRRLVYQNEAEIDYAFNQWIGHRKARTAEELKTVLEESRRRGLPILQVWIAEGLEDVARREWEASRRLS